MFINSPRACTGILVVLVMAATPCALLAQKPADSALISLENRWVEALVKGDTAALDSILVDSYVDTDESGHRSDKSALLAAFKSGDLKMTSINLSNMRVYLYGNFAVVTGTADEAGAFQGHPVAPRIVFTDSFVLKGGHWHTIASQRTVVPAN